MVHGVLPLPQNSTSDSVQAKIAYGLKNVSNGSEVACLDRIDRAGHNSLLARLTVAEAYT